jgi:hypothetical protein
LRTHGTTEPIRPLRGSFRRYLAARGAAIVAYQMVAVAVGWQIYSITHSALDLGLVGLVQFIPSLQLGEFESGATAALFGVVPAAVIGGVGTLLIVVLWRRLFPQLAQRDTL